MSSEGGVKRGTSEQSKVATEQSKDARQERKDALGAIKSCYGGKKRSSVGKKSCSVGIQRCSAAKKRCSESAVPGCEGSGLCFPGSSNSLAASYLRAGAPASKLAGSI